MQDLLSVIVPIYNVKQYLSKCLDSIINQTYKNLEIICINDGSTDGSEIILNTYALEDNRIKVINQKNQGLSFARNIGMKYASGQYISFVDSDDYLDCECYSLCIPLFNLDIDVVSFSAKVVVEKDFVKLKTDDYYYQVHQMKTVKVTPKILLGENVSAWNKIYKTEIIKKNNLLFPNGFHFEDAEFYWKYMSFVKKSYFLPIPLYNYTRRPGSIMSSTFSGSDKAIDHLKIMDHIFAFWFQNKEFENFIVLVGSELFEQYFWFSYRHSSLSMKKNIIKLAESIVDKYSLKNIYPKSVFIKNLISKKMYKYREIDEYNFIQKLFSLKKFKYKRQLYIMGFRIIFRRNAKF